MSLFNVISATPKSNIQICESADTLLVCTSAPMCRSEQKEEMDKTEYTHTLFRKTWVQTPTFFSDKSGCRQKADICSPVFTPNYFKYVPCDQATRPRHIQRIGTNFCDFVWASLRTDR